PRKNMRLHLRNPIRANCHGTPLLPGDQPGNGIEGTNSTIAQLKGLLMNCFICQEPIILSNVTKNLFHCPCNKMMAFPNGYFDFYQPLNNKCYYIKGSSAYHETTLQELICDKTCLYN